MKNKRLRTTSDWEGFFTPGFDSMYLSRQYTGRAWPLIKARSIKVPSELLSRGVTIRDIAGVGETNSYRANAHKRDSLACSVILVVTLAARALSESNAHDLMNDSIQRQARRDGSLLSLWFATSQKDNFSVDDTTWRKVELSEQHGTYQQFMERARSQRVGKSTPLKSSLQD